MRELRVVGLDVDGKRIICEAAGSGEKFMLLPDDRLRAAVSGEKTGQSKTRSEAEVPSVLRPKEIQARIRSGASVEQIASASGADIERVERFAHPVLLERSRAAELATAAHPVLADGPSVLTLLETVTTALVARGLDPDASNWDAWRNEDGRWTVQLSWKAGLSDNVAHFRFAPGAHGGTVTAFDDAASELIDPDFARPLRPVAAVPQLARDADEPELPLAEPEPEPQQEVPEAAKPRARRTKGKPAVPAWEDVLLGVRSSGQR
ncbi:septation protein SepH [Mycobacterium deserti]|uniref:Septation protein SepH n=1 Tax=Mycobacterium deserti TaxID=2978347 RepID=A0ABT2M5N5_9MYCO|nr:septation protein SepH [Mycobacterium deserti]MCT7657569.1 septation protein SepH [Mycobacterium deserti]